MHVFKLNKDGAQAEEMDGDEDGDGTAVTAATHWILPSQELQVKYVKLEIYCSSQR